MANNLFVSYDLHEPGQNYEAVIAAIKQLGDWAKAHYSLWYVKSNHTAKQAVEHVWKSMDKNDKLLVVDATNNMASWQNLSAEASKYLQEQWYR